MTAARQKQQTYQRLLPGLLALAAAFAAWAQLELSDQTPAAFAAGQWPLWAPLGALTALCLTLALYAPLGRWSRATALSGAAFTVLGVANYYTRDLHGTALMPQDIANLGTAAEVLGTYTLHLGPTVAGIAALYLPVLALAAVQARLERGAPAAPARRRWAGCAAGVAAVLLAGYLGPWPLMPRQATDGGWHWQQLYYTYGYLPGTVQACRRLAQPVAGAGRYGEAQLDAAQAAIPPAQDGGDAGTPPDVLLVLSESLYDLQLVTDLDADADCLAAWRALPGALRGYALSPHVGGGTNASEYTLLTSNPLWLLPAVTPFNGLDLTGANSLVRYFAQQGYATMAAHPYTAGNYRRDTAWAALGFEQTHFAQDFPTRDTYGARPYQTDAAAFADWMALYQAMPEDRPRFAFLVTIQTHGDYEMNAPGQALLHAGRDYGAYDAAVDEYLSCVSLTDRALAGLTQQLQRLYDDSGRRVLLAVVGDHAPSFVDHVADKDGLSYEELFTRERSVPYLLWANWPVRWQDPPAPAFELCGLGPVVAQQAGLPLTPYYRAALQTLRAAPVCRPQDAGWQRYLALAYHNMTADPRRQALFDVP